MTKKDTELLIFSCLQEAFPDSDVMTNYEWAQTLRLTPAKIKTMRLDAHLKFGHLFKDEQDFSSHFLNIQNVDLKGIKTGSEIIDVTVSFVVEDPVIQMELEQKLKDIGTYLDFHRNREVVKIRLIDFFRIMAEEDERLLINKWLETKSVEEVKAKEIATRVKAKEYSQKSELDKLMDFADDLSAFCQTTKLTEHLKKIFKSQGER
ncbi:hypothetical protein [Lentisphaera araneosa]|nr:hypothetical protein [Lentisphaera araneosa]